MGRFAELVRKAGHQPWFATVGKRVAPPLDRLVHRASGGRFHVADSVLPTLVLAHRGRRTGRTHRTPLAFVVRSGGYVVAATNWGQRHHPSWSENLLAEPDVSVELEGRVESVRARLVDAGERAAIWPDLVAMWPAYDTYLERSGRDIRVFVLEPRG